MAVIVSKELKVPLVGKLLSDYAVGESVFLNVNGTLTEFLVVNQGIPSNSSLYDSSCNDTWLLMKNVYEQRVWDSSSNDYENSDIHAYLNGSFLRLLDSNVQSAIKQVKIPYHKGEGSNGSIASGAKGLSTKVFLLSGYEVGWTTSVTSYLPIDGACISYFTGLATKDPKRIGYYNGTVTQWWLRSPFTDGVGAVRVVDTNGEYDRLTCSNDFSRGVRPALIFPSSALFDKNNVFKGVK